MAKIRHITLTTQHPEEIATFYKEAFGLTELVRFSGDQESNHGSISLTDGYINLVIQKWRTAEDPVPGTTGHHRNGIHHIGFQVDDREQACERLERAKGKLLTGRKTPERASGPQDNEMKWAAPDGVVLDLSQSGWRVS